MRDAIAEWKGIDELKRDNYKTEVVLNLSTTPAFAVS
jgi:hypothetical protein